MFDGGIELLQGAGKNADRALKLGITFVRLEPLMQFVGGNLNFFKLLRGFTLLFLTAFEIILSGNFFFLKCG